MKSGIAAFKSSFKNTISTNYFFSLIKKKSDLNACFRYESQIKFPMLEDFKV